MNKDIIGFDKEGNMFYYEENTSFLSSNEIFFLYFKTIEAIKYFQEHEEEARYFTCICLEDEGQYPLGAEMLYTIYMSDYVIYASEVKDLMPYLVGTEKKVRKILGIK